MLRAKAKVTNEAHILFRAQLESCNGLRVKEQWLNVANMLCQAYIYFSGSFEKPQKVCPVCPSAWKNSAPTRRT